jgi:hypothetical protein
MAEMGFALKTQRAVSINVPLNEFKHALFIGKTGNGKTTGGINPIMDSRISAGYGMMIFDEKGKEHRVVKSIAQRHGRLDDVVELGKLHGITVNLLNNLSERQLESFLRRFLKRSNDSFWTEGAINMVMALVQWLVGVKKLYQFGIDVLGMSPIDLTYDYEDRKANITHQWSVSTDPLSAKELSGYFHNPIAFALVSQKSREYVEMLIEHVSQSIQTKHMMDTSLNDKVLMAEQLIDKLKELETTLQGKIIKADLSEASGNNGNYFMIASVINLVGSDRYVNDTKAGDIAELLNAGKIVVINTESFSSGILASLLDQTLESLSTRSKHKNVHPISVIIDEANRVLSADSDIRIDVLRESKVEVIMATQNHEQMMTKMGEDRWLSFAQNFNTRYHFMGMGYHGKFKVINEINDQELEALPMFFEEDQLDLIEWEYQQHNGYYDRYIKNTTNQCIVIYDHLLIEKENKLLVYDLKTKDIDTITVLPVEANIKSTRLRDRMQELKQSKSRIAV